MEEETAGLWHNVTDRLSLESAWLKVAANKGSSGGDGVTLSDFNADLYGNIMQLRGELLAGSYRSGTYRKVAVRKRKPGYRVLTIPSVRDRVVHTSVANTLTPIFEAMFQDSSFAYRPNRGVVQAVSRIEQWRKRGYETVIEADIVSYFDNINHAILFEKLRDALSGAPSAHAVIALVEQIVGEQGQVLGTPDMGIAQGSPLSPLLANLYLDALDEAMAGDGVKIVRFADDFVILCKSMAKAQSALEHCAKVIEEHNLQLHAEGTRIVNFDKGFDFIGYLFLKSMSLKEESNPAELAQTEVIKLPVSDDGIIALEENGARYDPGQRALYLIDPTHTITRRNRSFSILRQDGSELLALPHRRVGRIEVCPNVKYDRSVIDLAIDSSIEFVVLDGFGQTRGVFSPSEGKRAGLHLDQARGVLDPAFRLAIARKLVAARIRNQRTQLMRINRDRQLPLISGVLEILKQRLFEAEQATSVEKVMGNEGAGTARYWVALGALSGKVDPPFQRSRPAKDALNAAINYLTGILERDIRAAIMTCSLLPGFAFLHGVRDRHDGLVYDFMEPFRAPLTEGLPVFLFNAKRLRTEMFADDESHSVAISDEGRRAIIQGYEAAVCKRVNTPDGTCKRAWRPMMVWQAQSLARAVLAHDPVLFTPYLLEA